ncbi:MAG: hypothetical protein ACI9PP_000165 [Halobacteriales archaeon]|jgi:hypothetical protein
MVSSRRARIVVSTVAAMLLFLASTQTVLAHSASLRSASDSLSVPQWLVLLTGGAVVGASFLLVTFATDRSFVTSIHEWRTVLPQRGLDTARSIGSTLAVVALVGVIVVGFVGPETATRNPAVLVIWVGWWAGFAMSAYLISNAWPAVDPLRAIASRLPSVGIEYPERFGVWPSVVGLLVLVFVEVVTPLADDPRLLATTVATYAVITLAGSVAVGSPRWFATVDPVARVFRYYGRVAPIGWGSSGFELRFPGMALTRQTDVDGADEVAFVLALVWVTTYDGLVTTPAWSDVAGRIVDAGIPPLAVYGGALVTGYAIFLGVYRIAARLARHTAPTYLSAGTLAKGFASPLLAIAAGYHLAHFLGYFLTLSPALVAAIRHPIAGPAAPVGLVLPGWFGGLELAFVLVGHVLAIWVAHAISFDLFPDRLQAIRSQYPFIAVMIAYTTLSLWIVAEPTLSPPYL